MNKARKDIFWEKLEKDGKVIGLSLLPPCQTSLELHSKRANFVAKMWRDASSPVLSPNDPSNHGWLPDTTINGTEEAYPEEIAELLIDVSNGDDARKMMENNNDILSPDEESSDSDEFEIIYKYPLAHQNNIEIQILHPRIDRTRYF